MTSYEVWFTQDKHSQLFVPSHVEFVEEWVSDNMYRYTLTDGGFSAFEWALDNCPYVEKWRVVEDGE